MWLGVAVVDDQPIFRLARSHVLADALYVRTLCSELVDLDVLSIDTTGKVGLHELSCVHWDMPELSSIVLPAHSHPSIAEQA